MGRCRFTGGLRCCVASVATSPSVSLASLWRAGGRWPVQAQLEKNGQIERILGTGRSGRLDEEHAKFAWIRRRARRRVVGRLIGTGGIRLARLHRWTAHQLGAKDV